MDIKGGEIDLSDIGGRNQSLHRGDVVAKALNILMTDINLTKQNMPEIMIEKRGQQMQGIDIDTKTQQILGSDFVIEGQFKDINDVNKIRPKQLGIGNYKWDQLLPEIDMDIEDQKNVDYTKQQKLGIDINSNVQNMHGGDINIRD